jgi:hypothetical protein
MRLLKVSLLAVFLLPIALFAQKGKDNTLTKREEKDEWKLLFGPG